MGDTCLPGLQGYPVQVDGWSGYTEKAQLATQNDISLQFAPNEVPSRYDTTNGLFTLTGNHTFVMAGTQYSVFAIRLAAPKQQGLKNFSEEPIAEFSIFGKATANQNWTAELAALVIPIRVRLEESLQGDSIYNMVKGDAVKLIRCIPMGETTTVVRYTTCVEDNRNQTTKIAVAYWVNGAAIRQDQRNGLPQRMPTWGIPPLVNRKFLTVFALTTKGKGNRQYIDQDGMLKPYQATLSLTVASSEFKNGFRLILGFTQRQESAKELNAYKCVAINKSRDIKNGKLLLDPATGRRFDEEVEAANNAVKPDDPQGYAPGKLWIQVCIVIGVLIGIGILAGILVVISQFMFTRKSADMPPLPQDIAQVAASCGKMVGS